MAGLQHVPKKIGTQGLRMGTKGLKAFLMLTVGPRLGKGGGRPLQVSLSYRQDKQPIDRGPDVARENPGPPFFSILSDACRQLSHCTKRPIVAIMLRVAA